MRPAYDTVAQAAGGFLGLLVNPENPRVVGPAIADSLTGFYAAYGVLGALVERGRTGTGRTVEVSMLEAMAHFNIDAFTHFFQEGEVMGPYSRPRVSQSYVMKCSDGKWIALHMSSPPKFWEGLARAIERPGLFDDPRFATREARIDNQEAMIDVLSERFKSRPRDAWCERLLAEDVPNSPMYDTSEALDDPQAVHLQLTTSAVHPVMGLFRTVRSPVSYDGEHALEVRPPPTLGEHNDEIRAAVRTRKAGGAA
jgi:crotonobetainyl-CoA:carnitine CoA-transferase CaiB-like acyl-CoA transferase